MDKKRLKVLWIAAPLLLALALIVYFWTLRRPADRLEASGTIEATEVDVSFQVSGRVESIGVEEGDNTTQGQEIGRLDDASFRENLDRARSLLESARSVVEQHRTALRWTRSVLQEQESAALAAVASARARLEEARKGPRPQELRQAESSLEAAEAALAKARRDLERAKELFSREVYSQAAVDSAEAAYVQARSQKDKAQEALDLMREGTRIEQIENAEAQLRQAEAALAQARSNWIQVQIRENELASAEARVRELEASANLAGIQLDYTVLKAPIAGWVLLKNIESGEVVNVGTPVVTLGDIESLWMNVYVGEEYTGRLRLGDPVEVQVDSHRGETFHGAIQFISREAEFTPKNVQTKEERTKLVYRVKVAIPNKDQKLKPGMPADALLRLH